MSPTITLHACEQFCRRVQDVGDRAAHRLLFARLENLARARNSNVRFRSHGFDLVAIVRDHHVVTVLYDETSAAMAPYITFERAERERRARWRLAHGLEVRA